jgi:small multidrug resistance pump
MAQEKVLRIVFRVAAVYNICWGVLVVLFPNLLFQLWGVPPINYPFIMSGLGMCIGLFGYGYWVVSRDLRSYPQLVIIGFLGKTLGPIGWVWTVFTTELPLRSMWTNVFNDLIWLPFFVAYFVWYRRQRSALSATAGR